MHPTSPQTLKVLEQHELLILKGMLSQTALKPLLPFEGGQSSSIQAGILYALSDYLELVDWTGRIIRKDKRGFIDTEVHPILKRLDISPDRWQINTTQFEAIHARRFNRIAPRFDTG